MPLVTLYLMSSILSYYSVVKAKLKFLRISLVTNELINLNGTAQDIIYLLVHSTSLMLYFVVG